MGGIQMQYNEQAVQKAMKLAQSAQGQQLLNMLKTNHSDLLNQAMTQASRGDYTQAQQALAKLFSDPEARKLLSQLGASHD